MIPEELKKAIREELRKGNLVVIHPQASKRVKGDKVGAIDHPR